MNGNQLVTLPAIEELVDLANEMAAHSGFNPSFTWTGAYAVLPFTEDGQHHFRLWVQVAPELGEKELSTQWLSDDGHNAIDAEDLPTEQNWLV